MAKVNFSARKDPLLRPRRAANQPGQPRPAQAGEEPAVTQTAAHASPAVPETRRASRNPTRRAHDHAVEEPEGVIAISSEPATRRRPGRKRAVPTTEGAKTGESAAGTERRERSRHVARRVQTSVSLPPEVWDMLDELGQGAGVSAGEMLTAVLTAAIPDTPTAALAAVEQLLTSIAPDEGPQEERNYRLPLDLRSKLDELSSALGAGPRLRSLLIRAILASNAPGSSDEARKLITTRRIDAMRTAMRAAD